MELTNILVGASGRLNLVCGAQNVPVSTGAPGAGVDGVAARCGGRVGLWSTEFAAAAGFRGRMDELGVGMGIFLERDAGQEYLNRGILFF